MACSELSELDFQCVYEERHAFYVLTKRLRVISLSVHQLDRGQQKGMIPPEREGNRSEFLELTRGSELRR